MRNHINRGDRLQHEHRIRSHSHSPPSFHPFPPARSPPLAPTSPVVVINRRGLQKHWFSKVFSYLSEDKQFLPCKACVFIENYFCPGKLKCHIKNLRNFEKPKRLKKQIYWRSLAGVWLARLPGLPGCLASWLAGLLAGDLAGWLPDWLAG